MNDANSDPQIQLVYDTYYGLIEDFVDAETNRMVFDEHRNPTDSDGLLDAFTAMHFRHGHIVWEDNNLNDSSIDFCLSARDDDKARLAHVHPRILDLVDGSLRALKEVPADIRYKETHKDD